LLSANAAPIPRYVAYFAAELDTRWPIIAMPGIVLTLANDTIAPGLAFRCSPTMTRPTS